MNPPQPHPQTPTQGLWQNIHGIVLTILWCFGADALLIIVRYYRNWHKYLLFHSMFGIINLLTVIMVVIVVVLDRSYLFNMEGFSQMTTATQVHFIFGMCFIFIIVGIQILGFVVKSQIEGTKQPPEVILRKKKGHAIFGYTFYALSKIQLVLGWYVPGPGWSPMMTILLVYYVAFFAFKFFYFERLYLKQSDQIYHSFYEVKPSSLMSQYESIGEMLENGMSRRKIKEEYPDTRYVLYKDKVYDVSRLLHPGGMYIFDHVIGEEISRYIHGAYGLEVCKMKGYNHTIYAKNLLNEMFAIELDMSKLKLFKIEMGEKSNIPTNWKLKKANIVSKGIKNFHFTSDRYKINFAPSILYLGRHFLMSPPEEEKLAPRLYTLTLCTSPAHQTYISSIYRYLDMPDKYPLDQNVPESIEQLPFVIKEYNVGGFSEYIHKLPIGQEIKFEGPFGRGLELEDGDFYAFCGGTGVLPLLDLIYELLLEVYRRVSKTNSIPRLPPGFKLTLYLSVNTRQDLQGFDIVPKVFFYCNKYQLDIFKLFVRVSKGEQPAGIPKLESRLDANQLTQIVNSQNITTALVCGSPEMNNSVGNCLISLLGKERVHIL